MTEKQVAVIAGGSRGIGRAVAVGLARAGFDVAIVARTKEHLDETAERVRAAGGRALVLRGDLTQVEFVGRVAEEVGRTLGTVDVLYNGLASEVELSIEEADNEAVLANYAQGLTAPVLLTKALLPLFRTGRAYVFNMISDWAMPNSSGPSLFVSAKFGLMGFGIAVSRELLGRGIRVTNILPGDTASELDIDDDIEVVRSKHGTSMISVNDIVSTILYCLELEFSKVDQIIMTPTDPEY